MKIIIFEVGSFPFSYLGLSLYVGRAPKFVWNLMIEGVEKTLSSWKAIYLSLRGRITPIHAVLSNLMIYYMSIFRLLALLTKRIEKLQRDFLRQGKNLERKYHLEDCAFACKSKKECDLEFRPLRLMTQALFFTNNESSSFRQMATQNWEKKA